MSSTPESSRLLRETLLFEWSKWNPATAWRSAPALAIALGVGIAVGHPAGGRLRRRAPLPPGWDR